jgi:NDP-sugar pyrophosphorylase family protein
MQAVIQSGGKGTRLRPYTMVLPKPLMPVRSKPVLELLLMWLRRNGIDEVYVTTGYLGHLIQAVCGDGRQWGLRIHYTREAEPMGTVGALGMLRSELKGTFIAMNGDVLTDLNLGTFLASHRAYGGNLTIATMVRPTQMDFGVIEQDEGRVTRFREKPSLRNLVSMGVYCMEPALLEHIPDGMPFGFDDLMACLLAKGAPVHVFQHNGCWLDIGRAEDFMKAQELPWDEGVPSYEAGPMVLEPTP